MTKDNYIPEIELNFENSCLARCFMCSEPHGSGNIKRMPDKVFNEVAKQLKDVKFDEVQTSGNGDALLHPKYFNYLTWLRTEFPKAKIHFYSSFAMMTQERADKFIDGQLINKMFTRIDTLNSDIFYKSTKLSLERVLENIDYFIRKSNGKIQLSIGYSNIKTYFDLCNIVIGKRPLFWPFENEDFESFKDEYQNLQNRFQSNGVIVNKINQSLWAERTQATPDHGAQCPKLPIFKKVIWICPNGDVSVCGYDDKQSDMICGNIIEEHMLDIWHGERRKEILTQIQRREIIKYPCISPACCNMYRQ